MIVQARRQRDGQAHTRERRSVCGRPFAVGRGVCGLCWAVLGTPWALPPCDGMRLRAFAACPTTRCSGALPPLCWGRGGAVCRMHMCPQALPLTVHLGVGAAADDCSRLPQICLQGTWGHHAAVGGHLATAGSGAAQQPATLKRPTHARLSDGRAMPSHAVSACALEAGPPPLPDAVPVSPACVSC